MLYGVGKGYRKRVRDEREPMEGVACQSVIHRSHASLFFFLNAGIRLFCRKSRLARCNLTKQKERLRLLSSSAFSQRKHDADQNPDLEKRIS
jgi:hypothetical protein